MIDIFERYYQTRVFARIYRHVICKMQKYFVGLMHASK
jgi:hypothetical protein